MKKVGRKELIDSITNEEFSQLVHERILHKDIPTSVKNNKNRELYNCYFDGACEPVNPGGAIGAGICINDTTDSFYLKPDPLNTNNMAEYMAFNRVLELLANKTDSVINIFGDSMLVVMQMNGKWGIKKGSYLNEALKSSKLFNELERNNKITLRWIPREQNEKADELSKNAIWRKKNKNRPHRNAQDQRS